MNAKTSDKPSMLSAAIRAASQEKERQDDSTSIAENHNTNLPESSKTIIPDETVNMTIKVSKRQRRHWLIEAKKHDTSLTAAIIEALNARFGAPGEQH